jgi:CubicO group peptidase (beta-lactamase class C family)
MGTRGLSKDGLARLHDAMAAQVAGGGVPGLVLAVSRGEDVCIDAVGSAAVGAAEPMAPDAIFRMTSMTRPITAVATLLLVEEGRLGLDEPVDRLLPELADRRVLRHLNGPVDDTVPAQRPITVRDLLTFRAGFGIILAPPSEYPVLVAEQALDLRSAGPPTPATPYGPDEWMRRMGTLPLMSQPGEVWRYATGSQILGVLVGRAAGQPVESFYRERIFDPLGMADTGFVVPAGKLDRLVPCYQEADGALTPFDDDGLCTRPPAFADCGAGLASTVPDYLAFARMLLAGGTHHGDRILAAELVAAMTTNQLTPQQRSTGDFILDGRGWGFGLSIIDPSQSAGTGPQGYGWSGGYGTVWANDPEANLVAILCTQVLASAGSPAAEPGFWSAAYQALDG